MNRANEAQALARASDRIPIRRMQLIMAATELYRRAIKVNILLGKAAHTEVRLTLATKMEECQELKRQVSCIRMEAKAFLDAYDTEYEGPERRKKAR